MLRSSHRLIAAWLGTAWLLSFPHLSVDATPIQLNAVAGLNSQFGYIPVPNSGGGLMIWNASATYQNGSGWLVFDPSSGVDTTGVYAGPAPSLVGVQQVNVQVRAGLPSGTTQIILCAAGNGLPDCSDPFPLVIQ